MNSQLPRRGISWGEGLLAVFAVMVILSLLGQTFVKRRGVALLGSCQYELRLEILGFQQYLKDYDQKLPPVSVHAIAIPGTPSGWPVALKSYLKGYFGLCAEESKGIWYGTDYYYNVAVAGRKIVSGSKSANSVLLTEGPELPISDLATASAPITGGQPPAFARHLGGSNYAFLDGHIKWLETSKAPGSTSVAPDGSNFTFGY